MFEGRAAIGYDYGYDAQTFYPRLALDPMYIEGFVEGMPGERIGEDEPEEEEGERVSVLQILNAECETSPGTSEHDLLW